jgi:hypothetical protein
MQTRDPSDLRQLPEVAFLDFGSPAVAPRTLENTP